MPNLGQACKKLPVFTLLQAAQRLPDMCPQPRPGLPDALAQHVQQQLLGAQARLGALRVGGIRHGIPAQRKWQNAMREGSLACKSYGRRRST